MVSILRTIVDQNLVTKRHAYKICFHLNINIYDSQITININNQILHYTVYIITAVLVIGPSNCTSIISWCLLLRSGSITNFYSKWFVRHCTFSFDWWGLCTLSSFSWCLFRAVMHARRICQDNMKGIEEAFKKSENFHELKQLSLR